MKQIMEEEIKKQEIKKEMEMLYSNSPDHLYSKMQMEYYSCNDEKKSITFRFPIQKWELNHMSIMHGGIIATAIDTTCGAIVKNVSGNKSTPTINLNINYLSPGLPEDALLVTATADRAGRKICNVHAVCKSEKTEKIIATATANFMILD